MSCASRALAGIVNTCTPNKGGIKKVWITNTNPEPFYREQDKMIAGFTKTADWYEYNFSKNSGSMTSTLTADPTTGTNFVTTNLILQFNRMDTPKRVEIANLALSEVYVIVQDSNNKFWYLGFNEPVIATTGTAQTGTAKTDSNNYNITLTDESKTFPYEILESAMPKPKPLIWGYTGVTVQAAAQNRNDNCFKVEGTVSFGNTVTLISNLPMLQQTWVDIDTGKDLGEKYMAKSEPLELTLDRTNYIYRIGIVGR